MYGVDLSHWNKVNWKKLKTDFVIIKATQGTSYIDPTFKTNQAECRKKGIKLGYYHFADLDDNIYQQADHFIDTIGEIKEGEFVCLDAETGQNAKWCKSWLEYVEDRVGFKPVLYAPVGTWEVALPYPLWIARYGLNNGQINYGYAPNIGKWDKFIIWQYTSKGKIEGVTGNADLNIAENLDGIGKCTTPIEKPATGQNLASESIPTNQVNSNNMQQAFSFDKTTLIKIGKGFLIAIGGAALTYFAEFIANTDFGVYTAAVVAIASILINAGKEFIAGKK